MILFDYKVNKASEECIKKHLLAVSDNFSPSLSLIVNIDDYAKKIERLSYTFECWNENLLVGLVACYLNDPQRKEGYITNVSVLNDYQKKGIGYKLINNAIEEATQRGFYKIRLEVLRKNKQAISLYKRLGFSLSECYEEKCKMTNWLHQTDIKVSICCITYNHESYIRQCLDGFMMQKTNFNFEVLIHDDASTDETAEVIREYENKYPNIIKPIYQIENQYSQGIDICSTYQFPRAKGEYIAMCEGDDYWTDPYKLQKQIDFMEANPEYSVCAHDTKILYENINKEPILFSDYPANAFKDRYKSIYTIEDTFWGIIYHTSSCVIRKSCVNFDNNDFHKYFKNIVMGDAILMSLCATRGNIFVMKDIMSVYRINSGGLISSSEKFTNRKIWLTQKILLYSGLNKYLKYRYAHILEGRIVFYENLQLDYYYELYRKNKSIINFFNIIIKNSNTRIVNFFASKIYIKINSVFN